MGSRIPGGVFDRRWRLGYRNSPFGFPVGGCSSVGRAVALQAIGQEFESPQLHQLGFQALDLGFEISNRGLRPLWACSSVG